MAKESVIQYAFNSGELSPHMAARADTDRYAYGARTMENFIPMLQGPARKRPGTKYTHDLKEPCFLLSVIFSQTNAWILAFGDQKIKFYTNQAPMLESAVTITGITKANPGVVTAPLHGFENGDEVRLSGIAGMTELNQRFFIVTNKGINTFRLEDMWGNPVDTSAYTAYSSGGVARRAYTIDSPWAYNDLVDDNGCFLMSSVQSEDVTYICVPGYRPRKLIHAGATNWSIEDLEVEAGPFIGSDPDETITVYASVETGTGTLTASSGIFTADHVGALFLLEQKYTEIIKSWEAGKVIVLNDIRRSQGHYYKALNGATTGAIVPAHTEGSRYDGDAGVNWEYLHSGYGWCEITAYNSATSVDINVLSRIPSNAVGSGNATTQWSFGAWSDEEGWPTHVCFFRERLCFGRGTKLWFSVPSDFENFAERDAGIVADDSAISIDIRQGYNDDIEWLMPSSDLLVGSQGNEFAVSEISTANPFGPGNIASLRGPGYGARRVTPVTINDGVFYVLPSGRVMRELRYASDSDGYAALNRTAFAEHITLGRINQISFAKEPESIVWANCANGALLGMSFEREHQLLAWHRHQLGGTPIEVFGITLVANVSSQAVIPSIDGTRDEWYGCVLRVINGTAKYYLEYGADHWDEATQDLADMYYVDCGISDDSNSSATITGLEHLEGETVSILGDGRDLGDFTVVDGAVELETAPDVVQVGLPYTATLESMNLFRPSLIKRLAKAFVQFISTVKAKASGAVTTEKTTRKAWGPREINWAFQGVDIDAPTSAQTRIVEVKNESDHGREIFFTISHDRPMACTVAGWTMAPE